MSVIVLTGFMGTGKTTVGRQLAARLHRPFIDTDARIAEREGTSVAALFATKGEAYFRAVEKQVVAEALHGETVVATGGGAILDGETARRMRAAGPIVCLTAALDVLLERTATDSSRPLLSTAERRTRVTQLVAERAGAYAQADVMIDTSQRSVEAVVDEIVSFLQRSGGTGREVQS